MPPLNHGTTKLFAAIVAAIAMPLAASAHGPAADAAPGVACPMPPPGIKTAMPAPDARFPGPFPVGQPPLPPHLHGLNLSEAQQDGLFALMHEQAPRLRELSKAAAKAMDELRKLAASDRYDPAQARNLADVHARALSDMVLMHAEQDARQRALLTPEQRKRLDEGRGACGAKRS